MISTVSIFEMNLIINCEHKDPHTILGMHEVLHDDREVVAVRAFLPGAKELYVIDKNQEKNIYKAEKIHEDGFFEAVIDDRHEWFEYLFHIVYWDGNERVVPDIYSFQPTVGDYDRYLLAQETIMRYTISWEQISAKQTALKVLPLRCGRQTQKVYAL